MEIPFRMPNKMDEDVANTFGGGITLFSTDFASKGLSWAGNMYQKWENICRDNIMVQEPSKLVDAVGEQFRKIYEEVADDLLNPFSLGSGEVLASDLSSDQDVTADVCKKSWTSHHDRLNRGPLIPPTSTLSTSSEEEKNASLPDIWQDERKEACGILNDVIALTPAEATRCRCSSESDNHDHEQASNSSTFSCHSGLLPSSGVFLSESPGSLVERGLMPSCSTDPTKEEGSSTPQEMISLVQPFSTAHEPIGSSELEASLSIVDAKRSGFFYEARTEHSISVDENAETNEEFEDVNLEGFCEEKKQEDCLEEAENYELVLISYRAMKNRSYKKKLRDVFMSRLYSRKKKNNEHGASFYGEVNADPANRSTTAASPVSARVLEARNLSTPESCESDWELL